MHPSNPLAPHKEGRKQGSQSVPWSPPPGSLPRCPRVFGHPHPSSQVHSCPCARLLSRGGPRTCVLNTHTSTTSLPTSPERHPTHLRAPQGGRQGRCPLTVHEAATPWVRGLVEEAGAWPRRGWRQGRALRGLPGGRCGAASGGDGQFLGFACHLGLSRELGPGLGAGLGGVHLRPSIHTRARAASLCVLGLGLWLLVWLWGESGFGPQARSWAQPGALLSTLEGASLGPALVSTGQQGAGTVATPVGESGQECSPWVSTPLAAPHPSWTPAQ